MTFAPIVPWWLLAVIAAMLIAGAAAFFRRDAQAMLARALVATTVLAVLANPVQRTERRAAQRDVAVAVVDRSASMAIDGRGAAADKALAALRKATPELDWNVEEVRQQPGEPTRLGQAIENAAGSVGSERLAGVVVISDGISADAPDARDWPKSKPLHLLIAGSRTLNDRRLLIERAPAFSVVGGNAAVRLRVDDGDGAGGTADLSYEVAGSAPVRRSVTVGEATTIPIPMTRRGRLDVAFAVAPKPGEATLVNNRALVRLNGVTDRLRVLLVSGVPYAGSRAWRDILKSDANIDLVHFTILRLPTSFDTTPPEEMSLIPFPVEELFERHLADFDLIIFDRFGLSELLSPIYFQSLGDRIRSGGGLLVVTGDEFAADGGLASTLLSPVLPVLPAGAAIETPFTPERTVVGAHHPVTATLPGGWGRWGSMSNLSARRGQVLMTGAGGRPLLILNRVGRGRVGVLASTSAWWWSRSVDGEGPRDELLRRIAHWLMREPDLEEERLRIEARGRKIEIDVAGVEPPQSALLTGPGGNESTVALTPSGDGRATASIVVGEDGLYRVHAGARTGFVLAGETAELAEVRPHSGPIGKVAGVMGGGTFWIADGIPEVRHVKSGSAKSGSRWLGLVANDAGAVVAVDERPLLPPALQLLLVSGALLFAWWRERG